MTKGFKMDKTKVDDMLIEMIKPKIDEIEKKFSSNQPLTQDDINTLLLKSQYNHINHLDQKLNETVEAVKSLEHKFEKLEIKVAKRLDIFEERLNTFDEKLNTFDEKLNSFKQEMEANMQKALNKNMMTLIIVIGAFLTLSKIIDKF
jgi:chromosome segregation ATPase